MRKSAFLVLACACSAALWAQRPEEKGLAVINQATAEAHIGFLASDNLEGREARYT